MFCSEKRTVGFGGFLDRCWIPAMFPNQRNFIIEADVLQDASNELNCNSGNLSQKNCYQFPLLLLLFCLFVLIGSSLPTVFYECLTGLWFRIDEGTNFWGNKSSFFLWEKEMMGNSKVTERLLLYHYVFIKCICCLSSDLLLCILVFKSDSLIKEAFPFLPFSSEQCFLQCFPFNFLLLSSHPQ